MGAFDRLQAIQPQLLAEGYLARALHGERLTVAVVEIDPGATLPEHHHDNEQVGMVIQGSIVFRIGDEEQSLGPGELWLIPSNTPHTVTSGDNGAVVIDVFSPGREDWEARDRLPPRPPAWP